ncbi:serine hydrolase [Candidatus Ichthyocystis hellenicum]|uniref:serine hydrolase n=1 Tax=Candidatus Ichthyocystis hellenicum TaxID=1561003 RepID=UPI001F5EFAC4|nr:serine hydrolase [Candidatus Ichthyocystis hellenicum]
MSPYYGNDGSAYDYSKYHQSNDQLLTSIQAKAYIIFDQTLNKILAFRNKDLVLPIASLTKLMTAIVVLDSKENLSKKIKITKADYDNIRHSRSHVEKNTVMTKKTALMLSLMASDNRTAHALARSSKIGYKKFITAMNQKSLSLGLINTHYKDPTGSQTYNVSTAEELVKIIKEAERYSIIRHLSTTPSAKIPIRDHDHFFVNTNYLVKTHTWPFFISKTGFINESGKCLAFSSLVKGHHVTFVILGSPSTYSRVHDAKKAHKWAEENIRLYSYGTSDK